MANKYLSSFLLFIVGCSIFIGSSSEAARLYTDDANIENFAASKIFGLLDSLTGAMKNGFSGMLNTIRLLSGDPTALGPEQVREAEEGFDKIRATTKDIKMVHSLLLGIILYPLAFILCCPISCCLGCVVGCIVMCVIWIVVVVLVVVGTLLFTPGYIDNALPYHASSTAEMVAQTLADICRESLKALEKISERGHEWPVAIALDGAEFLMGQIEQVGLQVQAMLNRAQTIDVSVREKLESVDTIFQTLLSDIRQTLQTLKKDSSSKGASDWYGMLFSRGDEDEEYYRNRHHRQHDHPRRHSHSYHHDHHDQ